MLVGAADIDVGPADMAVVPVTAVAAVVEFPDLLLLRGSHT